MGSVWLKIAMFRVYLGVYGVMEVCGVLVDVWWGVCIVEGDEV